MLIFVANMANVKNILDREITTEVFITGCSPHARVAAERGVVRWGWVLLVPLIITAIYGFAVDTRWLILSMAILLLIVPAVMLFGYIEAISDADAIEALYPRKVVFRTDGSVLVSSMPLRSDNEETPRILQETDAAINKQFIIEPGETTLASYRGHYLEVRFGADSRRMLIPLDAFDDPADHTILTEAFGNPAVNS